MANQISSKQATAVKVQATAPAVDPAEVAAASATAVAAASAVSPEARREARRQRHLAEAAKMHQAAAERGLATAQFNLATCYMEGTGIEEDKAKAVEHYEKAAAQGHWVVSASPSPAPRSRATSWPSLVWVATPPAADMAPDELPSKAPWL